MSKFFEKDKFITKIQRNIYCLIQNDDSFTIENLKATFKIIMTIFKSKRIKTKSEIIKKFESTNESIDIFSSSLSQSFVQFFVNFTFVKTAFIKTAFIKLTFIKNDSIFLNYSKDEKSSNFKSYYIELRNLFLRLIKKVVEQCFFKNDVLFIKK